MDEWVDTQFGRVRVGSPLANLADQINNPSPRYETSRGGSVQADSPAARFAESGGFAGLLSRMFPNYDPSRLENLSPSFSTGGYAAPMPNLGQMTPGELRDYQNLQAATAAAMAAFLGGGYALAGRGAAAAPAAAPGTSLVPYGPTGLAPTATAPSVGASLVPYTGAAAPGTSLVPYAGATAGRTAGTSITQPWMGDTWARVLGVSRAAQPALGAGTPAAAAGVAGRSGLSRLGAGLTAAGVVGGTLPIAGGGDRERSLAAQAARYQGLADRLGQQGAQISADAGGAGDAGNISDILSGLFTGSDSTTATTAGGYSPSFVDISAALAMLPMAETEQERAAIAETIADLENRAAAGVQAVRSGWDRVRAVNSAAADKARQMAVEAGPQAAALWLNAANTALEYGRQVGDLFTNMAGQQRVNISPTAGVANIAGLMLAQAPRAQAFAERMGLVSAEDIASQARTASMIGEAYAGEITRTALQMAQAARDAHNQRVQSRIAANQSQAASLIASAQATNAQIANDAARFAAQQVSATPSRQDRIRELQADVAEYANDLNGPAIIVSLYPEVPLETAQQLINGARQGLLDWERAKLELAAEFE